MSVSLETLADDRALRLLTDHLFVFTDEKRWADLEALFADGDIAVDMTTLAGGTPTTMAASDLVAGFRQGLHADKMSHHMVSNVRVELKGDTAAIRAQGYAWNRLRTGGGANVWETWGTYLLTARRTDAGWKLASFRYDAKLNRGNEAVRTHTLDG